MQDNVNAIKRVRCASLAHEEQIRHRIDDHGVVELRLPATL